MNMDKSLEIDEISGQVVDAVFKLHTRLGPGLLESVYELVLVRELERRGLKVERQKPVFFEFDGLRFEDAFRVDLLVEGCVVVELKSVETLAPVHSKQILTYIRLLNLPVGLLINFGAATMKEGLHRVVNNYQPPCSASPREQKTLNRRIKIERSSDKMAAPNDFNYSHFLPGRRYTSGELFFGSFRRFGPRHTQCPVQTDTAHHHASD